MQIEKKLSFDRKRKHDCCPDKQKKCYKVYSEGRGGTFLLFAAVLTSVWKLIKLLFLFFFSSVHLFVVSNAKTQK